MKVPNYFKNHSEALFLSFFQIKNFFFDSFTVLILHLNDPKWNLEFVVFRQLEPYQTFIIIFELIDFIELAQNLKENFIKRSQNLKFLRMKPVVSERKEIFVKMGEPKREKQLLHSLIELLFDG